MLKLQYKNTDFRYYIKKMILNNPKIVRVIRFNPRNPGSTL
jgi:hypothetical protein